MNTLPDSRFLGKAGKKLFPYYKYRFYQKGGCSCRRSSRNNERFLFLYRQDKTVRAGTACGYCPVLQKMEQERTMPKVGRNSMKRLTYKDPGANTIEVSGRIRSFERYARKHQVRYHIEKEVGTDPPKWTVYFKANQADALTAAFKEYTKKDLTRSTRPSLVHSFISSKNWRSRWP